MSGTALLEIRQASVIFDGATTLDNFSLRVERGEFVVLRGPTGCGKSTVLRLLAGLTQPSSGEVIVAGDRVDEFNEMERRWLRRSMGLMLQNDRLLEDRSIHENVMIPALAAGESYAEARRRASLALEKCGLALLSDALPMRLSTGEQQIALLARAVVNRPVVILADEPIAHLDETNARSLLDLLSAFARAGVTLVVTSHKALPSIGACMREVSLSPSGAIS